MTPRLEKAVVADVDQVLHFCRLMIDREHFGTLWPKYKATTQYHCMVCKVQDTDSKMDFPILCEHLLHRDLVQVQVSVSYQYLYSLNVNRLRRFRGSLGF